VTAASRERSYLVAHAWPASGSVSGYDRAVAVRPSETWRKCVEEQAAEITQGVLSPELAFALTLWPESLRVRTDAALATFEDELHELTSASDAQVLDVVRRVVLSLNKINDEHVRAGELGYETGEREDLCEYIDTTLGESGVDVEALTARRGIGRWEITDEWRRW
jgi:hypothetical protein